MIRNRQQGVALVTAIFLVVIVAGIGAVMLTIGQTQQQSVALSILGQRGMNAASSGLEWAIHRAIHSAAAGLDCSPGTVSFNPGAAILSNYTVAIECSMQSFEEGTTTYNVYMLTSRATMNAFGSSDFISRTLRATVCANCP